MSNSPFVCRWGILATGGIAKTFAKDILLDPAKTRGVTDVVHRLAAVASSSSRERAQQFLGDVGAAPPSAASAYGSYEELVQDGEVDVVYVATPHSRHYEDTLLCLEAGKHVCCEKPFTVNAAQTRHLIQVARSRNLFLMEGVWTRFFPLVAQVRKLLHEERALGKLHRVESNLSTHFPKNDVGHRLLNPELAGGALLDLGIYALTWQMVTLFEDPENESTPPQVVSQLLKEKQTGVDEFTTMLLNFPKMHAQGVAHCNMTVQLHRNNAVVVQCEKGDLVVEPVPYRPERFVVYPRREDGTLGEGKVTEVPLPGHGFVYEADAVARALRDGKKEADLMPLSTSVMTMEILDAVRAAGDFRYPPALEAVRKDGETAGAK